MARIRTIKPEFPQSESMGRISRDARLLFIQMWTLADDEGRLRGNSRMLASLLFPYDDDVPLLIDEWIAELENETCINRYTAEGQTYIQISNWLIHQKIDKPSKSKIPEFNESSRILANPRERSSEDQGSRIKDQGKNTSSTPAGLDELFDEFWSAYPRRVGKDAARKAFIKRKPTRELIESMLAAISVQAKEWNDPQYIPHPATWLNQGRWKDGKLHEQSHSWWSSAGFATEFDAENAGCRRHNAAQWREGKRIEVVA